jgi:hypothetical protein
MPRSCAVGRRLLLGSIACDAADVRTLLEDDEHSDGKERARVTGAVDRESALLCSPSALPDSSDDEQHDGGRSGDAVLPVWVDAMDRYSRGLVLPRAVRDGDRLAWVLQGIPRGWEDGDGDDDDEGWARDELVPLRGSSPMSSGMRSRGCVCGPGRTSRHTLFTSNIRTQSRSRRAR